MRYSAFLALFAAVLLPACASIGDAVRSGDVARVHAMLARSKEGVRDPGEDGDTPLVAASRAGNLAMVKELLASGGFDMPMEPVLHDALFVAMTAKPARLDIAAALIQGRAAPSGKMLKAMLASSPVADILWIADKSNASLGKTFLVEAMHAQRPDRVELVTKLLERKVAWDGDSIDPQGNNPLHLAAMEGRIDWMRLLMEDTPYLYRHTEQADRGNDEGKTALALASDPEIVALLEKHKASRECQARCPASSPHSMAQERLRLLGEQEAAEKAAKKAAEERAADDERRRVQAVQDRKWAEVAAKYGSEAPVKRGGSGASTGARPGAPTFTLPTSSKPARSTQPICGSYSASAAMRKNAGCN